MNFELPNVAEDYVHRIGRTGRAGKEGEAMSLVCVDELKLLKDIEKLIKSDIPKEIIEGYTPDPSIKAEPIRNGGNKGRGNQQSSRHKRPGKKPASNTGNSSSPWSNRSGNTKSRPKNRSQRKNAA